MARLEHFAVFADDTRALAAFYQDLFGLRIVREGTGEPPGFFLADGQGGALEIIGRPAGSAVPQRWVCHLAFWADNVWSVEAQLLARGFVIEQDTRVDSDALRTFFFPDPAGNRCQVVWRRDPL
jgi:glyoxylase I family protein